MKRPTIGMTTTVLLSTHIIPITSSFALIGSTSSAKNQHRHLSELPSLYGIDNFNRYGRKSSIARGVSFSVDGVDGGASAGSGNSMSNGISRSIDEKLDWVEEAARKTSSLFDKEETAEEIATEQELDSRKQELEDRRITLSLGKTQQIATSTITYTVELPLLVETTNLLNSNSVIPNSKLGLTLGQIAPGRVFTSYELDCDTVSIQLKPTTGEILAEDSDTRQKRDRIITDQFLSTIDDKFSGVIVTAVIKNSPGWEAGIRPGDIVSAVSATIGDALWPKSTLDGVRSALISRQQTRAVMGVASNKQSSIQFQMKRLALYCEQQHQQQTTGTRFTDSTSASAIGIRTDNQYELTIRRPLGFNIRESTDRSGYVEVVSINENASNLVRYGVQVGDKIVAIDSSFGDQLLRPASSTVEGVVAACTGRLPGQPVTIRFVRSSSSPTVVNSAVLENVEQTSTVGEPAITAKPTMAPLNVEELRVRCRTILKRYANEDTTVVKTSVTKSLEKFPALVADKVVDALASASAEMDCYTLLLIMNAYLLGGKPTKAIRIFEASTGFAGDGTIVSTPAIIYGKNDTTSRIYPTESCLNIYTCTALLRAHSARNDFASVQRVILAMEGKSGEILENDDKSFEVAPWPWTGSLGSLRPDTVCYNIAIAAAEKVGGAKAVNDAIALFNRMSSSVTTSPSFVVGSIKKKVPSEAVAGPEKNLVTFNTLLSILCNEGRAEDGLEIFNQMNSLGLKPDKFTYTSLIKICKTENDLDELLYDMRARGIQADIVTYNTIIQSLCDMKKWTKATKLISEMESKNISPDSTTYGLLMNGILKDGKANACLTLFETACASSRTEKFTRDVYLYTIAISAASKLGDHQRALELIGRMNTVGVKPNMKTLTAVMVACLSSNQPSLAVDVYYKIDKPDGYAITQGIQALCKNGKLIDAANIIITQKEGTISGKQMMYNYHTLLTSALEQDQYDLAKDIFVDLLRKGYIPNKVIYTSLLDVFELTTIGKRKMQTTFKKNGFVERNRSVDIQRFEFLLFVVDSLQRRFLPVEGYLFDAILWLGNELRGIPQRVVQSMKDVRNININVSNNEVFDNSRSEPEARESESKQTGSIPNMFHSWEEVFKSFTTSRPKDDLSLNLFPPLRVRRPATLRKVNNEGSKTKTIRATMTRRQQFKPNNRNNTND